MRLKRPLCLCLGALDLVWRSNFKGETMLRKTNETDKQLLKSILKNGHLVARGSNMTWITKPVPKPK
jgi:hypothetical protein